MITRGIAREGCREQPVPSDPGLGPKLVDCKIIGSDTMIASARSAEQWLTEVNQIVRSYRTADPREQSSRQIAIKKLKDLGLTEGDALRYLGKPDMVTEKRKRV